MSLDDSSVFAHRNLGYVLQWQRKYDNAIAEYRRASQRQAEQ